MEIVLNIWLAFNIVFGLWSSRNWAVWLWAGLTDRNFKQSQTGKMIDLLVLVSILGYWLQIN
jgi:hypothetical protein